MVTVDESEIELPLLGQETRKSDFRSLGVELEPTSKPCFADELEADVRESGRLVRIEGGVADIRVNARQEALEEIKSRDPIAESDLNTRQGLLVRDPVT